jgi:UDP:flavonoid glycosyltransferase YjiC (YdhE family)
VERDELTAAIDDLVNDRSIRERLGRISSRLAARPGTERAADLIERLAVERGPVTP